MRESTLNPLNGTTETIEVNYDGDVTITQEQDVESILDFNKEAANSGFNHSQSIWPVASIPIVLIEKWRDEEGIDVFDPNHAEAVRRKLNSIEFRHLRTGYHQL